MHIQKENDHFLWKNIMTRFGTPRVLTSDNELQFTENPFRSWCAEKGTGGIEKLLAILEFVLDQFLDHCKCSKSKLYVDSF